MKKKFKKYILIVFLLFLGVLFVIKFAGPAILRLYIETGIGSCKTIPVFCMASESEIVNPPIDEEYISSLKEYKLEGIQVSLPKEFKVVKQKITKVYYKKKKQKIKDATIFLLYEPVNFFVDLFPQLQKHGVNDNYEFIKRVMNARLNKINNLVDAFFVIMKGVFIPDLGDQTYAKIIRFSNPKQKGFIGYNMNKENYFDCNVITDDGFFKVYIRDKAKLLDLDKVFSIISTLKKVT